MKKKDRKKKKKGHFLIKLLAVMAAAAGLYLFASSSVFDVKGFEVKGNVYYAQDEILTMGDCKTGGNIFWGSHCKEIRERLEQNAYMESVKVKRILPDKIRIEIKERKQAAAIAYDGSYVVIDGDDIVLRVSDVRPQLPLIQGVTISALEEGQALQTEEKVRFRQTMEIIQTMEKSDMYFVKFIISESGVKPYVLDNLVCLGSSGDIIKSMEDGELQKVVQKLFDMKIERGTINVSGSDYISFSPEIA